MACSDAAWGRSCNKECVRDCVRLGKPRFSCNCVTKIQRHSARQYQRQNLHGLSER